MTSSIIRTEKNREYFAVSNVPFNDTRLSWEARGMLGYLLSKPDGWTARRDDLVNKGPAGQAVVRRVLAELTTCGYICRERRRENGKFVYDTVVYETPALNPDVQAVLGFLQSLGSLATRTAGGKPTSGDRPAVTDLQKTAGGKPYHIVSTDLVSTDKNTTTTARDGEIFKLYQNEIGMVSPLIAQEVGAFIDEIDENLGNAPPGETVGDWFAYAISEAVGANERKWRYVKAILEEVIKSGSLAAHKIKRGDNGLAKSGTGFDTQGQRTTNGKAAGVGNRGRKDKTGNQAGRSAPGLSRADIGQRAQLAGLGGIIGGSD